MKKETNTVSLSQASRKERLHRQKRGLEKEGGGEGARKDRATMAAQRVLGRVGRERCLEDFPGFPPTQDIWF